MEKIENKSFKKFLVVWIGQLLSTIGSGLTAFALGVYAFELTQTATSFALVTLCSFLPSILLRPFGGVLADRFDRRAMMIIGDIGCASGLIFILIMVLSGNIQLWQIYLGVTISSVFFALQSPAYKASVTDLLTEEQFSKATGLIQLASSAQFLFSPILAGFLMGITDIGTILVLDISTFIIAILAVFVIKKSLKPIQEETTIKHNFFKEMKEGWHAITSNRGVLLLVMVISLLTFYLGFLQTLLGPMILSFADSQTYGTAQSIAAIGMVLSSLFIGIFSKTKKFARVLVIALAFSGICFSLIGLSPNLTLITAAAFLFFCALPFINTSADVLVRKNIPNEKQGRVWGIIGVLSQLGFVIAYSLAGFLADKVFNPLLMEDGALSSTVGQVIGVGEGRGIGFLFIISGIFVVLLAIIASRIQSIKKLEENDLEVSTAKD